MAINREFTWIDRLRAVLGSPSSKVRCGIGDDAAILEPPKGKLLSTVDMLVEGVHFDLGYFTPEEVGHKALAVNLSDIAAMGGDPLFALVSLGVREGLEAELLEKMYAGIRSLADRVGVDIVGGNVARSPERLIIDVCLLGEAAEPVLRQGAKAGDLVFVTGPLGNASAGLHQLLAHGREAVREWPELTRAQLTPEPRLKEGKELSGAGVLTSLIDISDGLSSELHHLAEASHVGFSVDADRIPLTENVRLLAAREHKPELTWALHGGEDYELLGTLSPQKLASAEEALGAVGARLWIIGEVVPAAQGITITLSDGRREKLSPRGWSHL